MQPDLLLATDPDCDRVGIAVRDGDDYRLFTGNEVGAMLLEYILSQRKAAGTLPAHPVAVKTIVTTPIDRENRGGIRVRDGQPADRVQIHR